MVPRVTTRGGRRGSQPGGQGLVLELRRSGCDARKDKNRSEMNGSEESIGQIAHLSFGFEMLAMRS